MHIRGVLFLLAVLILCAAPRPAQAAPRCFAVGGPFNGTMALQIGSLVVPRDLPVGSWLYQQVFLQSGSGVQIECDARRLSGRTSGRLADIGASVDTIPGNRIYATGVPGIGVMWWDGRGQYLLGGNGDFVGLHYLCSGMNNRTSCRTHWLKFSPATAFILVKTGPVGAGVILASDLGQVRYSAKFDGGNEVNFATLSLRGSIQVVSKTCTTPNVSVPLSRHKVSSLKGIGSFTPTVTFEVRLTDCPGFPGRFNVGTTAASPSSSQDGIIQAPSFLPVNVKIRIAPGETAIDASKGVLGLTAQKWTATGVGVQLLDASGQPWILSKDISVPNLKVYTTSVSIKLGARYLQTATNVTPGWANAVATYSLTYQ
ncbi:fimbrial protein [Janthinobacterium sp. BJB446]|uniref:fimbrial protein n=1 Tax=Janthinobacterium sp. BJB446 TaxID=2048009 RepID=UPI0015D47CF0|nr:fimbrial protein [Janthinobacterium sp. BJB446]